MVYKEWDGLDRTIDRLLPFINKLARAKKLTAQERIECVNRISMYNCSFDKDWLINGDHGLYHTIEFADILVHLPSLHRTDRYFNIGEAGNGVICVDEFGNKAKVYFSSPLGQYSEHCPLIDLFTEEISDLERALFEKIHEYFQSITNNLSATQMRNQLNNDEYLATAGLQRRLQK